MVNKKQSFQLCIMTVGIVFVTVLILVCVSYTCFHQNLEGTKKALTPSTVIASPHLAKLSTFPVDVVYTWVDSRDEAWKAERNALTQRRIVRAQLKTHAQRWPVLTNDLSEITLSVQTVRAFMPWVRQIYVVTQRPQKLNDRSLVFVHHDEIMSPTNLPTFNSQAIETAIHKIPGLAEHFIYFNDDMFVGAPVTPSHFFLEGKPVFRSSARMLNWLRNSTLAKPFLRHGVGTAPAIRKMLKVMGGPIYGTDHQMAPLTKSLMASCETAHAQYWEATQSSKFRDTQDIAPVTMAYNHGIRMKTVSMLSNDTFRSEVVPIHSLAKKLKKTRPHAFCINDITTQAQLLQLQSHIALLTKESEDTQ